MSTGLFYGYAWLAVLAFSEAFLLKEKIDG